MERGPMRLPTAPMSSVHDISLCLREPTTFTCFMQGWASQLPHASTRLCSATSGRDAGAAAAGKAGAAEQGTPAQSPMPAPAQSSSSSAPAAKRSPGTTAVFTKAPWEQPVRVTSRVSASKAAPQPKPAAAPQPLQQQAGTPQQQQLDEEQLSDLAALCSVSGRALDSWRQWVQDLPGMKPGAPPASECHARLPIVMHRWWSMSPDMQPLIL